MWTPEALYERIVFVRNRDGIGADAACEKVAHELATQSAKIWSTSGVWFLTQVERTYFRRRGYDGGSQVQYDAQRNLAPSTPPPTNDGSQRTADAQCSGAPNQNGDGHPCSGTHITHAVAKPPNGDQIPADAQTHSVPVSEGRSGQVNVDAHLVNAATPAQPTKEGASSSVTPNMRLSPSSPGTPWPLRVSWNWDMEFTMPQVGRKRLRDLTREDFLRGGQSLRRSGETMLVTAAAYTKIGEAMNPGERLPDTLKRLPLIRMKLKQILPPPAKG